MTHKSSSITSSQVYIYIYIYIYAFSRRFYPKRLTVYSGYTFFGQYMPLRGIPLKASEN